MIKDASLDVKNLFFYLKNVSLILPSIIKTWHSFSYPSHDRYQKRRAAASWSAKYVSTSKFINCRNSMYLNLRSFLNHTVAHLFLFELCDSFTFFLRISFMMADSTCTSLYSIFTLLTTQKSSVLRSDEMIKIDLDDFLYY